MLETRFERVVTMLLVALSVTACDGITYGDSDDDDGGNQVPVVADRCTSAARFGDATAGGGGATLAYYHDRSTLYAFKPGSDPIDVDPIHDSDCAEPVATLFEGSAPQAAHPVLVLYRHGNGTFARAATDSAVFPPLPEQVSSFNPATPICFRYPGQDLTSAANAPIVFAVLATGTGCTDPARTLNYFFIRVGDAAGTPESDFPDPQPVPVGSKPTIVQLLDPVNYSHAGWLIRQNDELVRVSADGSSTSRVMLPAGAAPVAVTVAFVVLGTVGNGNLMLDIDGHLWAYDPATPLITDLQHDFQFGLPAVSAGRLGGEFYFVDSKALWRTRTGGTSAPVKIDEAATAVNNPALFFIALGADHVAWLYLDGKGTAGTGNDTAVLRSVPIVATTTGAAIQLDAVERTSQEGISDVGIAASGQRVFYNVATGLGTASEKINARSTPLNSPALQTTPDAKWINLLAFDALFDGHIYRVDGVESFAEPVGGNQLVALPADETATAVTLGTIPAEGEELLFKPGTGPGRLATLFVDEGNQLLGDILYFDPNLPNSLQRVTDTDTRDERVVAGF